MDACVVDVVRIKLLLFIRFHGIRNEIISVVLFENDDSKSLFLQFSKPPFYEIWFRIVRIKGSISNEIENETS